MVAAIRAAFADARCGYGDVDFRLTDNNGEPYGFKESALAMTRTLRDRKEEFDIWHPADCVGEVGAAVVPVLRGVMLAATTKDYAAGPGRPLPRGGRRRRRAAFVLRHRTLEW